MFTINEDERQRLIAALEFFLGEQSFDAATGDRAGFERLLTRLQTEIS